MSSSGSSAHAFHGADDRAEIYRRLGLGTPAQVHELIAAHAVKAPEALLQRGLNAKTLARLGYDAAGMRRLGYDEAALRTLGFAAAKPPPPAEPVPAPPAAAPDAAPGEHGLRPLPLDDPVLRDGGVAPALRQLLARGLRANELRMQGWPLPDCKRAGCRVADLIRFGFTLGELVGVCTAAELRREGFNARELKKFYNGFELREAGFSAGDMRLSGYNIRELLSLGYNENHIRTAGFSNIELMREGLSRTTRDLG